ncbi:MAG: hypothetical protein A2007_01205 [Verrucomicrobia bacterium GWC2_42_7]|nr:MAG: hypothetical protein A2007_01205 [Verrucomicrobia bacterium GWC2_42_7]
MYAPSCSPCPPSQKIELMLSSTFPRKTNNLATKILQILPPNYIFRYEPQKRLDSQYDQLDNFIPLAEEFF